MIQGFTFERALSWPFTAPHVSSFPWLFGLAYAVVFSVVYAIIGLLAASDFVALFQTMESVQGTTDEEAGLAALMSGFGRLLPWIGLATLAGWMIWAMFETASQRRYVFGESFSLGFGGDELRMMVIGLLWGLLGVVLFLLPLLLISGGAFAAVAAGAEGLSDEEIGQRMLGPMLGGVGLIFLLFPVYVFFATRLAPCFGLTLKEKEIRFFDAWNVSRGRFWPILGAYLILAIAGGILGQVITGIAQLVVMTPMMNLTSAADSGGDVMALLTSPGFLVPVGIYGFITLFVQGVLQHVIGAPAAFAVRHDPRGGVEQAAQIEAFI